MNNLSGEVFLEVFLPSNGNVPSHSLWPCYFFCPYHKDIGLAILKTDFQAAMGFSVGPDLSPHQNNESQI